MLQAEKIIKIESYGGNGNNNEILTTAPLRLFLIEKVSDLKISGLNFDYDPLPFSQADILKLDTKKQTMAIKIQKGSPPLTTLERPGSKHKSKWPFFMPFGKYNEYNLHYRDATD